MIKITFLFSLVLFSLPHLQAQDFPCTSFCVTDLYMDSITPNLMWARIHFEGDTEDFINYPHVPAVIDAQGDTIGTGDLWFFGQFGNTTSDYPVTTLFDSIPVGFTGTFIFEFDTTACELPFPCSTSVTQTLFDLYNVTIAPNPCRGEMVVYAEVPFENATLVVMDTQGKIIRQEQNHSGDKLQIHLGNVNAGVYCLQIVEDNTIKTSKKLVIMD